MSGMRDLPENYDFGYKKLTIPEAESIIGGRLDRRSKYFLWDIWCNMEPIVCKEVKHLSACSGCHETGDYGVCYCGGYDKKRGMEIGAGCPECGYTGVRWNRSPVPAEIIRKSNTQKNSLKAS